MAILLCIMLIDQIIDQIIIIKAQLDYRSMIIIIMKNGACSFFFARLLACFFDICLVGQLAWHRE